MIQIPKVPPAGRDPTLHGMEPMKSRVKSRILHRAVSAALLHLAERLCGVSQLIIQDPRLACSFVACLAEGWLYRAAGFDVQVLGEGLPKISPSRLQATANSKP